MGADTGLHANQAGREVGKPGFELAARELLAQNDGAALVEADEVECVLADVDAEDGDGVFRLARHGPGSLLGSAPRSTLGYCREHRRSIPLAEVERTGVSQRNNPIRWELRTGSLAVSSEGRRALCSTFKEEQMEISRWTRRHVLKAASGAA